MKKILILISSFFMTNYSQACNHKENKNIIDVLKDSKVPVKTESTQDGGRSTEGGNGNGGRPKIQK